MIRLLVLVLMISAPAAAAVVYVKADATGADTGTSWSDARRSLVAALAGAVSGDEIWIAAGTYRPDPGRSSSFILKSGVALYGGFSGSETSRSQRSEDATRTVLSGDIGAVGVATDNAFHVVRCVTDGIFSLYGVTVTDGYADGSADVAGGGIYMQVATGILNASLTMENCRLLNNSAGTSAAIHSLSFGDIVLRRCIITGNSQVPTLILGGNTALLMNGTLTMDRCVIADNSAHPTATYAGFEVAQTALLTNCLFANNLTKGPINNSTNPQLTMTMINCTCAGNRGLDLDTQSSVSNVVVTNSILGTISTRPVSTTISNSWQIPVDGDPLFLAPTQAAGTDGIWLTADDGYRLLAGSPCRDVVGLIGLPPMDLAGLDRPQGRDADRGAYEHDEGGQAPIAISQTVIGLEDTDIPCVIAGSDNDSSVLTGRILGLPTLGSLLPTLDGVTASGPALIVADLPYSLPDPQRRVLYRPPPDVYGDALTSFTVNLDDGLHTSYPATITVNVTPVNDAPTIDPVVDLVILEDSGPVFQQLINIFSGTGLLLPDDPRREIQIIDLTATSSNPAVVPHPFVFYGNSISNALLVISPIAQAVGSATISVTVLDSGGTADGGIDTTTITFTVTVLPVNDPPQINPIADLTIPEDSLDPSLTTVSLTGLIAGPANEVGQLLRLNGVSANPLVIGIDRIDYVLGDSAAQLRLALVPDASGTAEVYVSLFDSGGTVDGGADSAARVFRVTVTPVEDLPILAINTGIIAHSGQNTPIGADRLRLTDADAPPENSLVYTLNAIPTVGTLRLNGLALTIGETFTQAEVSSGLLTYTHTTGGTALTDLFTVTWSDGIMPAQGPANVAITITGNTLPTVSLPGLGTSWTEGTLPQAITATATVNDLDPLPWAGGSITAVIKSGSETNDVLSLADEGNGAGQVSVVGQALSFSGQSVGTWSGGSNGVALTVTLTTSAATPAAAQAIVRRLRFANGGGNPGNASRTIRVVVNDGTAGASVPADTTVTVIPVDNPPIVSTRWIAVPAATTVNYSLIVSDPDSAAFTWTLSGAPVLATITLTDSNLGRLLIVPRLGASGRETISVTVSDLINPPVIAVVELVITGLDDPRPHPAGELPPDAFMSGLLDTTVRFDCSDLGGTSGLTFQPAANAPSGLTLEPFGNDQVRIRWLVPTGGTADYYQRFGVIAIDPTSQAAGVMPIQVLVRPLPGGGG